MRPLLVLNGLGTGGAERSTAEFIYHVRNRGMSPTVACLYRRDEGVQDEVIRQGIDVRFLPGRSLLAKTRSLRSLITELRPDLVHTTIFEADIVGRFAAVGGPPVLSSLVNVSYDPVRRQDPNIRCWRLELGRLIEASTGRMFTTHFHAITWTVKRAAVAQLRIPPERITVVERGRDPRRLGQRDPERRYQTRRALGIADDAPVLISVGRQEYQKGQKYLLLALRRIIHQHPATVLLLVGRKGHASSELNTVLEQTGVSEHVRMLGHREDVPDLLASADVFVFPSLYEGLGGSVIEAMALGLPVVATDLPVLREVAGHNESGVLVPARSPQALAQAVLDVLAAPERAQALGERGREQFLTRFTAERTHDRMAILYGQIAERGRTGRI